MDGQDGVTSAMVASDVKPLLCHMMLKDQWLRKIVLHYQWLCVMLNNQLAT